LIKSAQDIESRIEEIRSLSRADYFGFKRVQIIFEIMYYALVVTGICFFIFLLMEVIG